MNLDNTARRGESFLDAEHVAVSYGENRVLDDVSIRLVRGKTTGILGPNGSGKSTLVRALMGSLAIDSGAIYFEGRPIQQVRPSQMAKRLAYVNQFESVPADMYLFDYVLLGRLAHLGDFDPITERDRIMAQSALDNVGLNLGQSRLMGSLSGGERQRAVLARALCQNTDYLVLDEPTNHLDVHHQHSILDQIRTSSETVLVVLHDLNMAARYCEELIIMEDGGVVASGIATQVLSVELIADVYRVEATRIETGEYPQFIFGKVIT